MAELPEVTYGGGWHDEDAPRPARVDVSAFGERPGSVTVPGPDPERDRRIDTYRDRERRRAARALDRYTELMYEGDLHPEVRRVAGERFVEEVGDYVLARLGERAAAGRDVPTDGMAHLYDCCSAGPTEPHTADCPRNGA